MDKFNYQVVFKVDEDTNIVFTGVTGFSLEKLLSVCSSRCVVDDAELINVVYQPFNISQNGSQKTS